MNSYRNNLPAVVERPVQYVTKPVPATYTAGENSEALSATRRHYLWILRLHRWKMLSFIAACVLGTVIVSSRLVPIYQATALVDIDQQTPPGIIGRNLPARP